MIRHYITLAFRMLLRNKFHAGINILGLAMGITVTAKAPSRGEWMNCFPISLRLSAAAVNYLFLCFRLKHLQNED